MHGCNKRLQRRLSGGFSQIGGLFWMNKNKKLFLNKKPLRSNIVPFYKKALEVSIQR